QIPCATNLVDNAGAVKRGCGVETSRRGKGAVAHVERGRSPAYVAQRVILREAIYGGVREVRSAGSSAEIKGAGVEEERPRCGDGCGCSVVDHRPIRVAARHQRELVFAPSAAIRSTSVPVDLIAADGAKTN